MLNGVTSTEQKQVENLRQLLTPFGQSIGQDTSPSLYLSTNAQVQPSTQAFSSRSHDFARNFVTSPNGTPQGTSCGDVTAFHTKSSRVSGRRKPGY